MALTANIESPSVALPGWELCGLVPCVENGRLTIKSTFWKPHDLSEKEYVLSWFVEDFVGDTPAQLADSFQIFVDRLRELEQNPTPPCGQGLISVK